MKLTKKQLKKLIHESLGSSIDVTPDDSGNQGVDVTVDMQSIQKDAEKESNKVDVDEYSDVSEVINQLERVKKAGKSGKRILNAPYGDDKKPLWRWLLTKVFKLGGLQIKQLKLIATGLVKWATWSSILLKFFVEVSKIPEDKREIEAKRLFYSKVVPALVGTSFTDFLMVCIYGTVPGIGLIGTFILESIHRQGLYSLEKDLDRQMNEWRMKKLKELKAQDKEEKVAFSKLSALSSQSIASAAAQEEVIQSNLAEINILRHKKLNRAELRNLLSKELRTI